MPHYTLLNAAQLPDLHRRTNVALAASWPEFMFHDGVARTHWRRLYEELPQFQFALRENAGGEPVAYGASVPLAWEGAAEDLPDEGWDWALRQGLSDRAAGRACRVLCALLVVVPREFQGRGISSHALRAMKDLGARHGLTTLIAPVRPVLKCRYPLTPMETYAAWRTPEGLPFDPWMRVHAQLGAGIAKVCPRSMDIRGSVAEWEQWTGMAFPESGRYVVQGALMPVHIDRANDLGTYVEPNVWMCHLPA